MRKNHRVDHAFGQAIQNTSSAAPLLLTGIVNVRSVVLFPYRNVTVDRVDADGRVLESVKFNIEGDNLTNLYTQMSDAFDNFGGHRLLGPDDTFAGRDSSVVSNGTYKLAPKVIDGTIPARLPNRAVGCVA